MGTTLLVCGLLIIVAVVGFFIGSWASYIGVKGRLMKLGYLLTTDKDNEYILIDMRPQVADDED